jgi:hypothetical protein
MKKLFLSLAGLFILNLALTQDNAPPIGIATELSTVISGGKSQFVRPFDNRFNDATKGSPFLQDVWLPGTLMLFDSSNTGDSLRFKFDTYHNEIWVIKNAYDSVILYSTYIRALDMWEPDGKRWKFKKYEIDNSTSPVKFYQAVYEGKSYTLVKDEHKLLVKANFVERGVYTTGLPYDRFEGSATDYYLRVAPDQPFEKISLKKKVLIEKASGKKANALESYCKKEKIGKNLSDDEAIQVLQFLEQ